MSRVKKTRVPDKVADNRDLVIRARIFRVPPSDQLQRALGQVFAPLTPEVMRATLAFEQIADADSTGMSGITERVWHETSITLIANALMPKFDLDKNSPQSAILQRKVGTQPGRTLEDSFGRAQSARITVMRRMVEQMLKGLATVRSVLRSSVGLHRTAASAWITDPSPELQLSIFAPMENPVAAFQARERALIALAAMVPDRILPLPGFRQIVDRRLQFGHGEEFLERLHVSLTKARRRTRNDGSLKVDPILLVMAQHWVNPDYPLWMMREPAATKVLDVVFGLTGDLTEKFRERRRKYFPGQPAYSILDATVEKLHGGLRRIKAYEITGNEKIAV